MSALFHRCIGNDSETCYPASHRNGHQRETPHQGLVYVPLYACIVEVLSPATCNYVQFQPKRCRKKANGFCGYHPRQFLYSRHSWPVNLYLRAMICRLGISPIRAVGLTPCFNLIPTAYALDFLRAWRLGGGEMTKTCFLASGTNGFTLQRSYILE